MKVYVESVPFCDNCPCRDGYFCNLIEKDVFDEFYSIDDENGIHKECPIKHISSYTKQVRKEVLGELMNILNESQYMNIHNSIDKETLFKVLDQIQGETKC